jgi:hypothetical protein
MIRKSVQLYNDANYITPVRLRRASRHAQREKKLQDDYNIQEHVLYRGNEIRRIVSIRNHFKSLETISLVMSRHCPFLSDTIGIKLISRFILPDQNSFECLESEINVSKILENVFKDIQETDLWYDIFQDNKLLLLAI